MISKSTDRKFLEISLRKARLAKFLEKTNKELEDYSSEYDNMLKEKYSLTILFPCEYNNLNEVDSAYVDEFKVCKLLGIATILFDHDKLENGKVVTSDDIFNPDTILIYRGWMLKNFEPYENTYSKLNSYFGFKLINNNLQYNNAHYSMMSNNLEGIRNQLDILLFSYYLSDVISLDEKVEILYNYFKDIEIMKDSSYIIKDFVKSEKDTDFFQINPGDDFKTKIKGFLKLRGKTYDGGLLLKKILPLNLHATLKQPFEVRAFVLYGKLFSAKSNSQFNFEIPKNAIDYLESIIDSKLINSNFYTIDIMQTISSNWILNEIGDGQVSGLASQQEEFEFYAKMLNIINERNKCL